MYLQKYWVEPEADYLLTYSAPGRATLKKGKGGYDSSGGGGGGGNNDDENEKSEDYSKADLKQRVLFFITIFRLAIPAFFRFTDVTELM